MAEDKKKRRGRRAYLDDFQRNVAGEFIYTGKLHSWDCPRGKRLLLLWAVSLAAVAAAAGAGCISDAQVERSPWVLAPYVASLIGAASQVWGIYRLTDGGDPVRDYDFEASVGKLPMRAILTAVAAGVAILAEAVTLFLPTFQGKAGNGILFMILEAAVMAEALFVRRVILHLKWKS